ncbi:hypothetical protein [Chamaesiphon sp. GL140_3_metabinner_50]|uniref:hypothetical protein n=1 Tax=Chamaesiphon sp. GL140_3_metabinner_50 TaxID=2970812 RepID=UPI0025ED3C57|nr:hypothetical protein [Chamaesiphon sp. GL140_3_metabinner_50]
MISYYSIPQKTLLTRSESNLIENRAADSIARLFFISGLLTNLSNSIADIERLKM